MIIVAIKALYECKNRYQREAADVAGKAAAVIRDGKLQEIPVEQIVVGDVVKINSEREIPADGLLIQVCSPS